MESPYVVLNPSNNRSLGKHMHDVTKDDGRGKICHWVFKSDIPLWVYQILTPTTPTTSLPFIYITYNNPNITSTQITKHSPLTPHSQVYFNQHKEKLSPQGHCSGRRVVDPKLLPFACETRRRRWNRRAGRRRGDEAVQNRGSKGWDGVRKGAGGNGVVLANVCLSVTSSNYVSAHLSEAPVRHAPLSSMSNEHSGRNVDPSRRGAARRVWGCESVRSY